jgi:hypothetical protein
MTEPYANARIISYFGQMMKVGCDERCDKAWGWHSRPSFVADPHDPDDIVWLADGELGTAPVDPGTYEGDSGKPLSPAAFPTTWCVRECERCATSDVDGWRHPLRVVDWSRRCAQRPD